MLEEQQQQKPRGHNVIFAELTAFVSNFSTYSRQLTLKSLCCCPIRVGGVIWHLMLIKTGFK